MEKSSIVEELLEAINSNFRGATDQSKQLKTIENLARKVIKKHGSLNFYYDHAYYRTTPLEAGIRAASLDVLQLLIKLGADLFFKPQPDMPSAIELLANNYFSLSARKENMSLFEWVTRDAESPLFTWEKLKSHKALFQAFIGFGLMPEKQYVNHLPIHAAIQANRLALVRGVLAAAGSMQKAGDIKWLSVLQPAIVAVLEGKPAAMELLKYLLSQGASLLNGDSFNLPPLVQAISAAILYVSNVKEDDVLELVKLLLEQGATLDVTNPNSGYTPLMSAMTVGNKKLFYYLLEKADAKALNHQAQIRPYYLIFQLFSDMDNRIGQADALELLAKLKAKGLEFDKTIHGTSFVDPFSDDSYAGITRVSGRNMSLLHFYVEKMALSVGDAFFDLEKHLVLIQSLITHGADPQVKATFTSDSSERDRFSSAPPAARKSIELTAAEYARTILYKIVDRYDPGAVAYLIKTYKDEHEFLKNITHKSKEEQIRAHKKFHQFRNLERCLSGESVLPYCGLPDIRKITKSASKELKAEKPAADFNSQTFEAKLLNARAQQNQVLWDSLQKEMIGYVEAADSVREFLARAEQFKKPLQLHFNSTTNSKGEVVYSGSAMYRFFHLLDAHKFPGSWEAVRKFGQETYGIDINTQYEQRDLQVQW